MQLECISVFVPFAYPMEVGLPWLKGAALFLAGSGYRCLYAEGIAQMQDRGTWFHAQHAGRDVAKRWFMPCLHCCQPSAPSRRRLLPHAAGPAHAVAIRHVHAQTLRLVVRFDVGDLCGAFSTSPGIDQSEAYHQMPLNKIPIPAFTCASRSVGRPIGSQEREGRVIEVDS